ncbi:transmembrane sensor [Pedobacter sp. W3I1]|uniref:FecR family protein n=1 Tax=Pedobacter sp. W3I1 TaxID=3042291 RepID=UPI002781566A|nr:FecR family protein [Pedobacter sp. W3I1]MDQ0637944.1 transmembrane sensor [Pedobacter sp. W3I1]
MDQQSFYDLLNRYENGNCTEAERLWVDKWYHNLNKQNFKDLSSGVLEEMQMNTWLGINNIAQKPTNALKVKKLWPKLAIAASIMIAFFIAGLYLTSYNHAEQSFIDENEGLNLISKTNEGDSSMVISLSDESTVTLKPKANIIYPKVFATNKRMVYLKGSAFFSVSKNPKRPFYVYNQKLVVRVLGTSFWVKSSTDKLPAQVAVRTGKVQVEENQKSSLFTFTKAKLAKPILLTPNQKGVFVDHKLNKTLVNKPIPLAEAYNIPTSLSYNFKEESVKEIFKTLSEAYGIEIKMDNEQISTYTFTGDLSKKGLYEQLDLICGTISSKYYIQGTSIIVSNKN